MPFGVGAINQGNTSGRVSWVRVLLARNLIPGNRSTLVMAILVPGEPKDFSRGIRHPDAKVEQLIKVIRKETEVGHGPNILLFEAVARINGRIGDGLVDDDPPVRRLLDADVRQTRRKLNGEVSGANGVVSTVVTDPESHDCRFADLSLFWCETHVGSSDEEVRHEGGGEDGELVHVERCYSQEEVG